MNTHNGGVTGGALASKMHHAEMHGHHPKPDGVADVAMADGIPFNYILLSCEDQTNKVSTFKSVLGNGGGIVWELSHEELDFPEFKCVLLCDGSSFEVLHGTQEK